MQIYYEAVSPENVMNNFRFCFLEIKKKIAKGKLEWRVLTLLNILPKQYRNRFSHCLDIATGTNVNTSAVRTLIPKYLKENTTYAYTLQNVTCSLKGFRFYLKVPQIYYIECILNINVNIIWIYLSQTVQPLEKRVKQT